MYHLDEKKRFLSLKEQFENIDSIFPEVGRSSKFEINDYFMDRLAISSKLIPVLFSYNMGIAVEEGDSFVAEWEIGKRI